MNAFEELQHVQREIYLAQERIKQLEKEIVMRGELIEGFKKREQELKHEIEPETEVKTDPAPSKDGPIRLHELAKQLNVENKDLIAALEALGIEGKNHMSNVTPEEIEKLLNQGGN